MRYLRFLVPILGTLALISMLLKVYGIFSFCKFCTPGTSYFPILGAAYFAALTAVSLFFPRFPGPRFARAGLVWAIVLAFSMTYFDFPKICTLCLLAHCCHILIWTIWVAIPLKETGRINKKRFSLLLLGPISAFVFFASWYFIFLDHDSLTDGLKAGDAVPSFSTRTIAGQNISDSDLKNGKIVLNFISPECPYCQQQNEMLREAMPNFTSHSCRFINIAPEIPAKLINFDPNIEWVEDREETLQKQFRVLGYPTLFVVKEGRIIQVILGASDQLKTLQFSISLK